VIDLTAAIVDVPSIGYRSATGRRVDFAWLRCAVKVRDMPKSKGYKSPSDSSRNAEASELERLRAEVARLQADRESRVQFYQLWKQVLDVVRAVSTIAVCAVPLLVVLKIVQAMAGKETHFTADVRISVAVTVAVSIAWGVTALQSHRRKEKVRRLRERADGLEGQLIEILRPQVPQQWTEPDSRVGAKGGQDDE
jgi:predicted aminopeptidase